MAGQLDPDVRADSRRGREGDGAVVQVGDLSHDREAQPAAGSRLGTRSIDLVKALEDLVKVYPASEAASVAKERLSKMK